MEEALPLAASTGERQVLSFFREIGLKHYVSKQREAARCAASLCFIVAGSYFRSAAWAAASRAIGTRYGEQLT